MTKRRNTNDLNMQLLGAAGDGNAALCQDALEQGANVHTANKDGSSALRLAAWGGHTNICQLLLEHGANVNAVDGYDRSALHMAAWRGCADTCLALLECNANFKLKTQLHETALELATRRENDRCASAIRSWIVANAARLALQEITVDTSLKAVAP